MKKIAPALAAGNSVIVKPSEVISYFFCYVRSHLTPVLKLAPITVLEFAEIASEAGGIFPCPELLLLSDAKFQSLQEFCLCYRADLPLGKKLFLIPLYEKLTLQYVCSSCLTIPI